MKFSVEKKGDVTVIQLHDHLVGGPDAFELKDAVVAELSHGGRRFVIDMTRAKVVNSGGIGILVACLSSIRREEGILKLCGVSDRARRAFVITGVWSIFEVFDTLEEALASFAV